jgi:hypothetical protein
VSANRSAASIPARRDRERLRRAWQPARVKLLFVGESPPASGRFFYQRDSGLYRAMLGAFRLAGAAIDGESFLKMFQDSGCYLVDLCPGPVDDLDPASRRKLCRAGEASLARTIAQLQPEKIATLLRSIEGNVARAALRARWSGPFLNLPYPGRWVHHQRAFETALAPAVRAFIPRHG